MMAAALPVAGLDELLLAMADDEFVIGFSDSEWTGIAPMLEEDVAMSSLSQDELGHAAALYALLGGVTGQDPDAIAYDREPDAYRHARLLDHGRGSEALSHTLLLAQTPGAGVDAHVETGRLFLRAGSPSNALDEFVEAIDLEPGTPSALAGAVEAAFALRDYARAGRFLTQLRKTDEMPQQAADLGRVLDVIVGGDPMAPRLSSTDRARRLAARR